MKTIFRFLSFGAVLTALVAVGATASYAQETCADVDGQTALYTKFTELYPKTPIADREATIEAGKQFLEKYGSCDAVKEQADYLKAAIPKLEEILKKIKDGIERTKRFARFDDGINSDNGDEIFAAGKDILAKEPDNLNVMVPMGVVGLYKSYNKDNKYASDSIKYAKMSLDALKAGKSCNKKNKAGADVCGALKYEFLRQDAIDELSYSIAYLTFYAKGDKKGALPLYYELSQTPGKYKNEPRIYATMGSYFAAEIPRLTGEVAKLIEKQKGLPTDDEKIKMEPEIKGAIALLNGYAERAMDGFIRAYNTAKSGTPAEKTYRDSIYKDLTVLYQGRFDKKDGLDSYIVAVAAKPMPNPTSEVTPVSDPEPVVTTTTITTTVQPAKPVTNGQPPKTTPAAVVTKPVSASAPAKTPAASTVAIKGKPVVKKPVAKKKGKG